jgi:hypothetical protein
MIRRYVVMLVMAMWMGGFTFYALIVIPTAEAVLGSERQTGFITQQVTRWLNLIGLVALLTLLWNVRSSWKSKYPRLRLGLLLCWTLMFLAQAGLFITHPFMDKLLDPQTRAIHGHGQFANLHQIYLTFATTQWIAALSYIWIAFNLWRHADQQTAQPHPLATLDSVKTK